MAANQNKNGRIYNVGSEDEDDPGVPSQSNESTNNALALLRSKSANDLNLNVAKKKKTKSDNRGVSKSFVWKYFKKINTSSARCTLCKNSSNGLVETSRNTSNQIHHLKKFHAIDGTGRSRPNENTSQPEPTVRNYLKKKAEAYKDGDPKKRAIDKKLVKMVTKDYQPFDIVNDNGFQEFCQEMNDRYPIPSRTSLTTKLLPEQFDSCDTKVREILNSVDDISITFDTWTSVANRNYLAITSHFIHNQKLSEILLGVIDVSDIRHRGINLAEAIDEVLRNYNIKSKIKYATTDNANNMGTTCKELNIKQMPCFPHTINLLVHHAIEEYVIETKTVQDEHGAPKEVKLVRNINPEIRLMIHKAKKITEYFHRSPFAQNLLNTQQTRSGILNPLKLIQDVDTRWNSTLFCIERVHKLMDYINVVLGLTNATNNSTVPLTQRESLLLPEVITALKLFDQITAISSGSSYVTISKIIPLINGVRMALLSQKETSKYKEIGSFIDSLLRQLKQRLQPYEDRSVCLYATLLDPRFPKDSFSSDGVFKKAKAAIIEEIKILKSKANVQSSPSNQPDQPPVPVEFKGVLSYLNKPKPTSSNCENGNTANLNVQTHGTSNSWAIVALDEFLDKKSKGLASPNSDVIEYWLKNEHNHDNMLRKLALQLYIIQGSSVSSERTFSTSGLMVTKKRAMLSSENINFLVFLNRNE